MSDDETRVRALLLRATADLPDSTPPLVADLESGRRHRTRGPAIASVGVIVTVVLVVVGIAQLAGGPRHRAPVAPDDARPTVVPTVTAADLADYRWRALPPAPVATRSDPAVVWSGRELIVWGGDRGNSPLGDGASYDPRSRTWTKLPPAPISPRAGAVATWAGNSMLIWGAFPNAWDTITDGARFDPASRTWYRLPPVSSAPGYSAGQFVTVGSLAVLLRYRTAADNRTSYGHVVRADAYDPRTDTWHRLPDFTAPIDHDILEVDALGVGASVYLWASWAHTVQDSPNGTSTSFGIDTARLDVNGGWTTVATQPDRGYSARGPQLAGDSILLPQTERYCGGCAGPPLTTTPAVLIDLSDGHRSTVPSLPFGSTDQLWTGGAVLALGGISGPTSGRTAAYDPETRTWHTLSPRPSAGATAGVTVWTGHELIEWGDGDAPAAQTGLEFTHP